MMSHERRMVLYARRIMPHVRRVMIYERRMMPHKRRMMLYERCIMKSCSMVCCKTVLYLTYNNTIW
jgi:hypothetical protein